MARPRFWTFHVGMSTLLLALVVAGFAPTFFLRSRLWPRPDEFFLRHGPELPTYLVAHGAVLTTWFVLALLQPSLVAAGRVRVHRWMGAVGLVVAAGVVFTGLVVVALRDAPRLDEITPVRPAGNLMSLIGFSFCAGLGFSYRSRPVDHRSLMTIASVWVVGPALTRLAISVALATSWFPPERAPLLTVASILSLLGIVVLHDRLVQGRLAGGTRWGLSSIPVAVVCTIALVFSGVWMSFVRWFA